MINNDVLRSIRYTLDLSDHKVVEIAHLADPALVLDRDKANGVRDNLACWSRNALAPEGETERRNVVEDEGAASA